MSLNKWNPDYGKCLLTKDMFTILRQLMFNWDWIGGCFDNGRPLPEMRRERVLHLLYHDGFGQRQIPRKVRSIPCFVQKVMINRHNEQNTSLRAARVDYPRPKIDEAALECIEVQKVRKPSIYSSEIQPRLLLDGVVHPADLPTASVSQINKVICKDLVMTTKKITAIPLESTTSETTAAIDDFLEEITDINPTTLHFFDETVLSDAGISAQSSLGHLSKQLWQMLFKATGVELLSS